MGLPSLIGHCWRVNYFLLHNTHPPSLGAVNIDHQIWPGRGHLSSIQLLQFFHFCFLTQSFWGGLNSCNFSETVGMVCSQRAFVLMPLGHRKPEWWNLSATPITAYLPKKNHSAIQWGLKIEDCPLKAIVPTLCDVSFLL